MTGQSPSSDSETSEHQPPLVREGVKPIALSLAVGAVGGALFALLHVPLAWLLGPIVFNIVASVKGLPVLVPNSLRIVILSVIGVFLGASFTPEMLVQASEWAESLLLMFVFIPLITTVAGLYYRRVAGFDRPTAMFSGAPGTMTAMVMIGSESGADERMIALTQGLRVVIVVFFMPLVVVTATTGGPVSAGILPEGGVFSWPDLMFITAAAVVGYFLARLFKLPASAMTGAMLTSAAMYLSDVVHWRPPEEALWFSFWILGSSIGSRFSTVTRRTFLRVSRHAVVATFLVFAVSAAFAEAVSQTVGVPFLTAFLSFTPGGVAEMCLIAIAFDIDPAFVAVHHLVRIVILVTTAPLAAKWLVARLAR